jgi:hypothetical protein
MNWFTHAPVLVLAGLLSLGAALWAGIHLQHVLEDGGGSHVGEFVVLFVLALVLFGVSRLGLRGR